MATLIPPLGDAPAAGACECRCDCGSLLARLVDAGVELKCRRCKRTLVVPLVRTASRRSRRPAPFPLDETG